MIRSIRGDATRQFVESGKAKFPGLDVQLAMERLAQLDAATRLSDLGNLNSVGLHRLKGDLRAFWSIDINAGWRLLFKFRDGDAFEVHIFDPH